MSWIQAETGKDYPEAFGIEYRENVRWVNLPDKQATQEPIALAVDASQEPVQENKPEPTKTERKK